MRDSLLVVLIVTLLTFNVSAQITSVKEYAQFNKYLGWQEVVENQGSRSIVAMHTTFDCPTSLGNPVSEGMGGGYDALGGSVFWDHKGIRPGGIATLAAEDPSKCRGGVDLVIFSNGQIEGDSRWVNDYYKSWSGIHEGVIQSLPLLGKVANQEGGLAEAEDDLRHRMESIPDQPGDTKGFMEKGVYVQLESLLRGAREGKTVSDSTPHLQPRSDEVAEVGASGIPRKQERKVAIFLVSKLQEWKTALENGLASPAAKRKRNVAITPDNDTQGSGLESPQGSNR